MKCTVISPDPGFIRKCVRVAEVNSQCDILDRDKDQITVKIPCSWLRLSVPKEISTEEYEILKRKMQSVKK